jgi:ferredoxin
VPQALRESSSKGDLAAGSHSVKQENHCVCGESSYLSSPKPPKLFMADAANKYSENVEGKFYVDDQCIDCDLCRETAPANFKRNDDGGHSFVYKQPESPEEENLCKEAMEGCPVEAIGSDGDSAAP